MRVLKSHEAIDEAEKLIVFSLVLVEPILFLNERISPLQQQLVDMVVKKAVDLLQAVLEDLLTEGQLHQAHQDGPQGPGGHQQGQRQHSGRGHRPRLRAK